MILETLKNGAALERFERMLINQQVMPSVAHELCYGDVGSVLPGAKFSTPLVTACSGRLSSLSNDHKGKLKM